MAQTLITPTLIAKEALFHLENNCVMGGLVHREYKNEFVKIGNSVNIRKPVKFVASDGATRSNQNVVEDDSTSITIDKRKHVSWTFSSQDLTLTIDEYAERYVKPAMIALADQIDRDVHAEAILSFFNYSGTPGNTPDAFSDLSNAAVVLDNFSVPDDGMRRMVLSPTARWAMANGMGGTGSGGVFNADIVHGMVRKGMLGQIANFDIYGSQNVQTHTVGTWTGTTIEVDDASFTNRTNTITIDGMTGTQTDALVPGDIITIEGVFAVNPVNFQTLATLQRFVVLTALDTTAGAGSFTVYPTLDDGSETDEAATQTVSALPADNADITVLGTAATAYEQNLAFHRNALALVTVPLELPDSASFKARADWRGYSIRVVKDYDIEEDEEIIRLDVMYGVEGIYPELGMRVYGAA